MKPIVIAILFLFVGVITDSRANQLTDTIVKPKPDFDFILILKLKDQEIITKDLILGLKDFKKLDMLSNEEADGMLGKSSRKRVVLIVTPVDTVNFIKTDQLLDRYSVANRFRKFQFQIDGKQVLDPKAIIAADNAIYSLDIDKKSKKIIILSKDEQRRRLLPKTEGGINIR